MFITMNKLNRAMKTGKTFLGIILLGSLFFTSCNDDDGYSLGKFWISTATAENPDNSSYFFFDVDSGERMWLAATGLPGYRPKDGQRIIANYTILSDRQGVGYDHDVRLNNVYEILTKDIIAITAENNDSIGNDAIKVEDIWIANNYLNVEFVFGALDRVHYINLSRDAAKNYGDGKIHLEFRHNANGDSPMYNKWGMASFNLEPLQSEGSESLTLVIHTNEYGGSGEKVYELTYNFDNQSSSDRVFEIKESLGNIK